MFGPSPRAFKPPAPPFFARFPRFPGRRPPPGCRSTLGAGSVQAGPIQTIPGAAANFQRRESGMRTRFSTPPSPGLPRRAALAAAVLVAGLAHPPRTRADDGPEPAAPAWMLGESDAAPRLLSHGLSQSAPHRGQTCETFSIDAAAGSTLRLELPIGQAAVIDELTAAAWIRANRPAIRLAARVMLPDFVSRKTGRPVELLLPGPSSSDVDRWEQVRVTGLPQGLARRLPALHLEHGPQGTAAGAVVTHLVLDMYSAPGRYEIAIDDVTISGRVPVAGRGPPTRDPLVRPVTAETSGPPVDPPAGLARGVLEVAGIPFFPRVLDHSGEPLAAISALGFNCVRLPEPATAELLAEARTAGLWVVCPPPTIPDIDLRDPDSVPALRNWDRVLMWDLGSGLAAADVAPLAEQARRIRACDLRQGRPLVASADSDLREVSRHVDMLVARRTVLGTSLELTDYLTWLRERPRLTRPGTPLLATLSTEIDPRAARQAMALAGIGGRGLAVDPESLCLAAISAVAAGARGILFASSSRIDADHHEARLRAAAAREMNMRLAVLEPWAAAGRFSATAQTSDPEVQAMVVEAARARMVVAWRCVQGAQICARRYEGALPKDEAALTVLVPGMPEAHQAWVVGPGGLKPLRQRRVTGGVAVTLDHFTSHALVLCSGEPAVTAHVQERLRQAAPAEMASARTLAGLVLADDAALLGNLPPQALGNLPVAAMLGTARQDAVEAEGVAAADPATAVEKFRRCTAICGQFERLTWERGVQGTGSMLSLMASPLSISDATLAEQWRFTEAVAAAVPGPELLAGGAMERVDDLAGGGWRHFAQEQSEIRTAVEISRVKPFAGGGCLRLEARAAEADAPPIVVETPPVWITTPPLAVPVGKLLEISARVWVPKPILGSVDGLLVFDSLGGPALAERVGATRDWTRLAVYRIVPPDAVGEPLTVTFAVTGLGEALIDDVSVRVLEHGLPATPATTVSTTPGPGFPTPHDLLSGPPPIPRPAPAVRPAANPPPAAGPQWPGMNLEWPNLLPFAASPDTPPPGVGGGTIDPFKRARPTPPSAP